MKRYIKNIQDFRDIIREYFPGEIWLDEFSEEIPYIVGSYKDKRFNGAYNRQCGLCFEIDSLSQMESVFKEGMYIIL